jgi:hypothetical protein
MKTSRGSRWIVPVAILGVLVFSGSRASAMSSSDTLHGFFRQAVAVIDAPRTETHLQGGSPQDSADGVKDERKTPIPFGGVRDA